MILHIFSSTHDPTTVCDIFFLSQYYFSSTLLVNHFKPNSLSHFLFYVTRRRVFGFSQLSLHLSITKTLIKNNFYSYFCSVFGVEVGKNIVSENINLTPSTKQEENPLQNGMFYSKQILFIFNRLFFYLSRFVRISMKYHLFLIHFNFVDLVLLSINYWKRKLKTHNMKYSEKLFMFFNCFFIVCTNDDVHFLM